MTTGGGPRQGLLPFAAAVAYGRQDFLAGEANRDALAWIERWPDWPDRRLVVHGPEGCGKTHLAAIWQARSGAAAVAAETLAGAALPGLAAHPALVVEAGEGRVPEEPLLHLLNLTRERGAGLLLLARRPPAAWGVALPDLASRLKAMAAVAIGAPDDALLGAVLAKLFADRQLRIEPDVIEILLRQGERSFAAARCWVEALDQAALAEGRRVGVRLARQMLAAHGPVMAAARSRTSP